MLMMTNNIETEDMCGIVEDIYESIKPEVCNSTYNRKQWKKLIAFLYLYGKYHLDIIRNNKI